MNEPHLNDNTMVGKISSRAIFGSNSEIRYLTDRATRSSGRHGSKLHRQGGPGSVVTRAVGDLAGIGHAKTCPGRNRDVEPGCEQQRITGDRGAMDGEAVTA